MKEDSKMVVLWATVVAAVITTIYEVVYLFSHTP